MGSDSPAARHGMAAPRQGWAWAWAGQSSTIAKAANLLVHGGLVRVHPNVIPPEKICGFLVWCVMSLQRC